MPRLARRSLLVLIAALFIPVIVYGDRPGSNANDSNTTNTPSPLSIPSLAKPIKAPTYYFSIYYQDDPAHSFERASNTWVSDTGSVAPSGEIISWLVEPFTTESDFKMAWSKIHSIVTQNKGIIGKGQVFSHASKEPGSRGEEGIECRLLATDGTITKAEIEALPRLNWDTRGVLILAGCNTGLKGKRGWSPAESFANTQKVKTIGQAGFAFFSEDPSVHKTISASSAKVYLWAFERRQNVKGWGSDKRMPGITYYPPP